MKQVPLAVDSHVLCTGVRRDGVTIAAEVHVGNDNGTWTRVAVVVTGGEPTEHDLAALGRMVWLGVK